MEKLKDFLWGFFAITGLAGCIIALCSWIIVGIYVQVEYSGRPVDELPSWIIWKIDSDGKEK